MPSLRESKNLGWQIGRLNVATDQHLDSQSLRDVLIGSDQDLVVLRFPTSLPWVPRVLSEDPLDAWLADSLIYFAKRTSHGVHLNSTLEFRQEVGISAELRNLIDVSFAKYESHYAATFKNVAGITAASYVDWMNEHTEADGFEVFSVWREEEILVGFVASDETNEDFNEWTLAAVHPSARGQGLYRDFADFLTQRTFSQEKGLLVTPTQVSNAASINGFVSAGFRVQFSLYTYHVVPPESKFVRDSAGIHRSP